MKLLRFLTEILYSSIEGLLSPIPGGMGRRLRYRYYRFRLKHIGRGVVIDVGVRILNPQYVSIGDNSWIDNYVIILAGPPAQRSGPLLRKPNPAYHHKEGEVHIGCNTHIANFVVLQGHGGLSVGANSTVASGGMLYSLTHHYSNPSDREDKTIYKFSSMADPCEQSLIASPVVMEDNTALGLNSVMLPGATISEGSWVGVNSVVQGCIPPYSIARGNPAVVIKERPR